MKLSNYRRALYPLLLLVSSSLLALYFITVHDRLCDQSSLNLDLSAISQFICLLSKCYLDHFYLSKYGYIKIKVI